MSRPYHGRRRRRPGRRLRYPGGNPPRRGSYQSFGLKTLYDLLLPGIRGPDRRRFFNDVSFGMALLAGAIGAVLGWGMLGPLGAFIGFGLGMTVGAETLARNGYYRP